MVTTVHTTTPFRRSAWPVLLGAALLAGACTSAATDESGSPSSLPMGDESEAILAAADDSVAEVDETPTPDADDFNLLLESEVGLGDLRPADVLDVVAVEGDDQRLLVTFEMESHHCFGVTTDVAESDLDVVVEVRTGLRADVNVVDCELGVYPYTTEIALAAPLGERVISAAERREPAAEPDRDVEAAADRAEPAESIGPVDVLPEADDTSSLIGIAIEDGVEWALINGVEWRILSMDGESMSDDDIVDPSRISFVVERDRIVAVEWS